MLRVPTGSAGPGITTAVCKPASDYLPSIILPKMYIVVNIREEARLHSRQSEQSTCTYQYAAGKQVHESEFSSTFVFTYCGLFGSSTDNMSCHRELVELGVVQHC